MTAIQGRFSLQAVGHGSILTGQEAHEHAVTSADGSPAVFVYENDELRAGEMVLGRYLVEDRSLLPKRVLFLSSGQEVYGKTEMEARGDNRYIIKTGGAPVGVQDDGHLYADLMGGGEPTEFELIPQ